MDFEADYCGLTIILVSNYYLYNYLVIDSNRIQFDIHSLLIF